MRSMRATAGAMAVVLAALPSIAQSSKKTDPPSAVTGPSVSADPAQLTKATEEFVRQLFGWGPNIKVTLGPFGPSPAADFYTVPIEVLFNEQKETGQVYVSKDGKTLLRGELYDMAADPFAANRAKIHLDGSPTKGPADARVTVVEFADFECPHCRELWEALTTVEGKYPQVRVVYKDFPLTQIHPWANTAALGGRCAFRQSPTAFWKVHDAIFDNQDLISPENVWDKLVQFAIAAGLNADAFKSCLAAPDTQKDIDASHAEGVALGVNSTPTVYINGRPLVGGDVTTLSQYVDFELAAEKR
ncbi:MAG TPA: thioredoxin domain-containing protein [Candidatus Acidoferrales bacterium]|nr:thioredoxin domain-containing protein [Candidatus Acidoferrales bacterium]